MNKDTEDILSAIIKSLERRWGLTLVSFLSAEAQAHILKAQGQVSKLFGVESEASMRQGRIYIEFYEPQHFHCTHLTLMRSDPGGPVEYGAFVKEGHHLFELFRILQRITSRIGLINVRLDRLTTKDGEFGLILLGECVDEVSKIYRRSLIGELNEALPGAFNVASRAWDTDPSKFDAVHSALGYVKRPLPQGYSIFMEDIKRIELDPIIFTLDSVTLVHHRFRSLAFPQQGSITLPLGKTVEMDKQEFVQRLNLLQ